MGTKILIDARVYAGGFDFSGDSNQVALAISVEAVEMTPFGYGGGKKRRAGLTDANFEISGFVDFADDAQDENMFDSVLGVDDTPITVSDPVTADTQAEEDPATFGRGVMLDYSPFQSPVGAAAGFDAAGKISGVVIPGGRIMHPDTPRTSTGTTTGFAFGALAVGETMYSALHVIAVSGTNPTLDVIIQSDTSGFPSTTNQVTFPEQTAVGSEWGAAVAGSVDDTFWRVSYTIGGTDTPTFTFIVVMGLR